MATLVLETDLGNIRLVFQPDAAPKSVEYYKKYVEAGLYNNSTFYRSDFVIQCGTHGLKRTNTVGDLPVNETHTGTKISNTRGTAAIAHWDVPDCGNTEFFINLQTNSHLDSAYGGYCVFAVVDPNDGESNATMDKIADEVKKSKMVTIESMKLL